MEVIVSGRHVDLDDDTRSYAQDKVKCLATDFPKLTSARVVVHLERSWIIVEVHLHGKHLVLEAKAQSRDVRVSIDAAVEKIEKQLRRHVERLQEHRLSPKLRDEPESEPDDDEGDEPDESLEE